MKDLVLFGTCLVMSPQRIPEKRKSFRFGSQLGVNVNLILNVDAPSNHSIVTESSLSGLDIAFLTLGLSLYVHEVLHDERASMRVST